MKNLYCKFAEAARAKQISKATGPAGVPFAKMLSVTALIIALLPFKLFSQAPTISYSSPQTYTAGTVVTLAPTSSGVAAYGYSSSAATVASGFNTPMGLATDAAGNIYVADFGNKLVEKVPAGGGTPTNVGSGFTGPTGVAVDAAGNIWVIDSGDLKEVPAGGGAIVTTPFGDADGVAVDSKGNVFVLETSYGFGTITEFPVGSGTGIVLSNDDNNYDTGIAVDRLGNIFESYQLPIVDPGFSQIEELGNSSGYNNLGVGLIAPTGVAVDGIGNVFVADAGFTGIVEYPVNGAPQFTIGSGLSEPNGIALDGAGNIYESDRGTNTVKEIKAVGGYFISPGLPAGLNLDETTGIISGTPTVASPATNYTITAHNSSGSTFAILSITVNVPPVPTVSYSSPQTYTVGRAITPLTPTSSAVAAPAYNTLPAIARGPGFAFPADVAIDAAGNLYVAQTNATSITKLGGGTTVAVGSGFVGPLSVAVDAAGNIYVADSPGTGGTGNVYEIPAGSTTKVSIGSGFVAPDGVAVDAAGNVYVADAGDNTVKKIPVGGGTTVTIGSRFNHPVGIAVDAARNVYVADAGNNAVKEIIASNGSTITLGPGFSGPKGVAVDAQGNVFVGDTGNNQVKEVPVGGGAPVIIGSGFSGPWGLTVDSSGNVYVADFTGNAIKEIILTGGYVASALPQGLSIDRSTGVISGTPTVVSTATNYTVTGSNFSGTASATVNIQVAANPVTLANLALSSGTLAPSFASGTINYTASVTNTVASITVTPTTSDPTATVTVNSATVISGSASPAIPLAFGTNAIAVVVTAADGVSTNTYTVNVTRAGLTNSGLASITLSTGTLNPAFATATTSYVDSVSYSTSSITLTPTTSDPTATVKVNGTTVASGSASASIPLTPGTNPVIVVVTAEDGITTTTYTVFVTSPTVIFSYSSPITYTAAVAITPLAPTISSGTVAAPAYSSSFVTIASGFNFDSGVAADAAGNVYVADGSNNAVKKIPAEGGSPVTIGSGFAAPFAVAVDAVGNVYVADSTSVKKVPVGGGAPIILASGLSAPSGIAVDAAGNVYVSDTYNNLVKEIPVSGGAPVTIASVNQPYGLAVDAAGNLYIADYYDHEIKKIPAGGGAPITINTGASGAIGVAVDAAGSIFLAYPDANLVTEVPAGGGAEITIGSGFNFPMGVAADGKGNVYVADTFNNTVEKIKPVGGYYIGPFLPAGLSFNNSTGVISGTPTTLSPATNYFITAYNSNGSGAATTNIKVTGDDASLKTFTISNGTLSPGFLPGTTNYTDIIANTTASITVLLTTNDPNATVTVNGTPVTSGVRSPAIPMNIGNNTLSVIVTGKNGINTQAYTIIVTRMPSADALLTSIKLTPAASLTIVAGPSYVNYTTTVANTTGSVTVTPTIQDATASITVNGIAVASGVASQPIALSVGSGNFINIVSTAQDGTTTKTYTITITRLPSTDATLSNFTISNGTLSPVFSPGVTSYSDVIANLTSSITVLPTTSNAGASIIVNGILVASGTRSSSIPMSVGANTLTVLVIAQDGVTEKTYVVTVNRTPSSNALLTSITLTPASALTVVPGPGYVNYTTVVPNTTSSITVTPTEQDATATIKINGTTVASGTASAPIALASGANVINIVVTAQDGITIKTYTITVGRGSTDALLTSIKLTPTSTLAIVTGPGYVNYTTTVPNTTSSVMVTATTQDATATIMVNGIAVSSGTASQPIALATGSNVVNTVITAQNGIAAKTYTITITRLPSTDATLSNFTVSNGTLSPAFSPGVTSYSDVIANLTSSITVLPTTSNAGATITVNGAPVITGVRSPSIPMNVGANTLAVVVTAQDGITKKTYTVTVDRALSSNALLSSIALSPATTLTGTTGAGYLNFSAAVANSISSIQVIPTAQDATATITVNGKAVASGTASASIALAAGPNTITTVITAQDGSTTKTIFITVTRKPSSDALLTSIKCAPTATLKIVSGPSYVNYTTTFVNSVSSLTVTATEQDLTATLTVNGTPVASGVASPSIPLTVGGGNVINIVSTAQDGTTTKTYTITATRNAPPGENSPDQSISVTKPTDNVTIENDGIVVHPGVSPNGDGINDVFTIEGLMAYPQNKVSVLDRNGVLIYQANSYDNQMTAFDGHSNINGRMQLPGTYFYTLDYNVNGRNKHKTGYIILKY